MGSLVFAQTKAVGPNGKKADKPQSAEAAAISDLQTANKPGKVRLQDPVPRSPAGRSRDDGLHQDPALRRQGTG
jgi:hypothetical protein